MGFGRLALAALAVVAVVTLLAIGGRALLDLLDSAPEREPAAATGSATDPATDPTSAAAQEPTVRIECVAETCPLVTVRVPGGDVLQHREMSRGEEVSYFQPELAVVLSDAGTVRVVENGRPRAQGEDGAREAFTIRAPTG